MLKIRKIVYFLSYAFQTRRRRRRKKMNKIENFKFGFLKLVKVSGTFGVDVTSEY